LAVGFATAQEDREPVLYVKAREGGQSRGMSWNTTGMAEYRLCTHWDGPRHGMAAKELFRLRRSVLGLKPGERLQFYQFSLSAEGTGKDGSEAYQATTTSQGAGRYLTTFREPHQTTTRQPEKSTGGLPPSAQAEAELIRTVKGARLVLKGIPSPHVGDAPFGALGIENLSIPEDTPLYTVDLTEAELAGWERLTKTLGGRFQARAEFEGSWSYSATLTTTLPDLGEVDVEVAGHEDWIPLGNLEDEAKPGNTVKVTARLRATGESGRKVDTKAEFTFELTDVSQEPGVCLNWPTQPDLGGLDLRLRKVENEGLEVVTEDRKLRSKGLVQEATLVVSAFDFAAWGVLKVTAKDKDGKELKVTYHKKELSAIQLPKDEDRNRIADAWQAQKGVSGFPASWDEAEAAGQTQKGDGLTLFQKYRGFMVAGAGGRKYTRLEPREKVHFIIDPNDLLDVDRWRAAAGIRAYKVFESWTKDRKVDIHADFAHGGGKFASRIRRDLMLVDELKVDLSEEDRKKGQTQESAAQRLRAQWAVSVGREGQWRGTPREVEDSWIYSGRIHDNLCRIRDKMRQELRNPSPKDEADRTAFMNGLGLPKADLLKRLETLTDAEVWGLVKAVEPWLAIHEIAHTCGLPGHLGPGGNEDEDCANRVPSCPMQYLTWQEKRRLVLFGELGGTGKFCSQPPHSCWKQLSPKN